MRERFVGEGMQDVIVLQNQSMERQSFELALEIEARLRGHPVRQGARLRARRPAVRSRCRIRSADRFDDEHNQFLLDDPRTRAHAGDLLGARRDRRRSSAGDRARAARAWHLRIDVIPSLEGDEVAPRLVERRFGDELTRVRESLAAWQLRVPQLRADWDDLEPLVLPVGLRPRVAADAQGAARHRPAARSRDAVVHDRLRPRHAHHLPADPALRAGAGEQRARGARRAAGDRGRSLDRRRAGEDRPRGARRQGGRRTGSTPTTAPSTRRRSTCPALRGLALDRRRVDRARAEGAGAEGARLDRRVRRPRRRRLRRVPAANRARAREPVLEGLGRLAALLRRHARPVPDRPVRGAGLRLRREAAHGRAGARGLARPGLADRLEREAEELRRNFDETFWTDRRGGYFALALDGEKRPGRLALLEHRPPALERDRPAASESMRSWTR